MARLYCIIPCLNIVFPVPRRFPNFKVLSKSNLQVVTKIESHHIANIFASWCDSKRPLEYPRYEIS